MYCEYCGSFVPDDQKFCSNCGAQIPKKPAYAYQPVNQSVEVTPGMVRNVSVEVPRSRVVNYTAKIGMIFGIVSMVTIFILYTNIVPAVIGFIFSLKGLKKSKELGGRGMCIAGIILSCAGASYWLLAVIMGLSRLASSIR